MTDDLCKMDALSCAQAIAGKRIAPDELIAACLVRIEEREESIGAWQFLDQDIINAQLKRLELVPEDERGPLHGIPVGVKDVYDTADMPTAYGSQIYQDNRPPWDAASVALLRAAGAVILGKTVSTEFAYWKAGKTRNPHNKSRTPGGSSSGSSASVADFMVPLATGSQTVASTMRPAAYCGVVGYKPSFGRVSVAGIKALAGSLDTVGVFARSVSDAALIAGVMGKRPDWFAREGKTTTPVLRLARTSDWTHATSEAVSAVEQTANSLMADGASITNVEIGGIFTSLSDVQNTVLAFEAAREFSSEWNNHRDQLSPQITELIEEGLAITPDKYETALNDRERSIASLDELFGDADVLLAPSAAGEAPPIEDGTGDPIMSRAWTLMGLPSISLPCGVGPSGLPLGLQIAARPGKDTELIAAARWIEERLT